MNEEIGAAILETLFRIDRTLVEMRDLAKTQQHPGDALSRDDRQVLGALLPGVSSALGDLVFTVSDLISEADEDETLQRALERSFGLDWRKRGKTLGKLLARADGAQIDGYALSKEGSCREGAVWKVGKRMR